MKFFFKTCLLLTPLGLIVGLNMFYNSYTANSAIFEEEASYLIGSSRVQLGLNPVALGQNTTRIYNVGISGATFFHNVMLAEHLMKQSKPKELFIELSPLIYTFSEAQKSLGVMPSSAFKHLLHYNSIHLKEAIDILEMIIFNNLTVKDNLKTGLVDLKLLSPEKKSSTIGYLPRDGNAYFLNDSFLKQKDIETRYQVDVSEYFYYISFLTKLAEKDNVKLRFFLPLTFNRQAEREIVCTVYQSLPDAMKVKYSSVFIKEISHSEYLFNKNHFNRKGAEIMTDYFGQLYFK